MATFEELLGGMPEFTVPDATERTGLPGNAIRRLWRALGFALPASHEPAFTEDDLAAIILMKQGSQDGVLDLDTELRLVRALGRTTSRLAEWQVSTVAGALEDPTGPRVSEALGPPYDELLVFAWRRHLAASVSRLAPVGSPGEETVTRTVGFADIVAFTALSNELDEDRLGDLVEIFETRASDAIANLGGHLVKTLGDAVLFTAEDAVTGMEIAHGIIGVIGDDSRLPDVRLGLATGPVILRFGDVFGPPVNMAARLTAIARRNRVIIDDATARRLPETRYETRALTARPVRGFGIVEPFAVRRV